MTQVLGYFRPPPHSRRRGPLPFLAAGVLVALAGFCFLSEVSNWTGAARRREETRIAAASVDVVNLATMLNALANDTGRYPSNAEGFAALSSPTAGLPGWNGPYVQQMKNDPWGHPYVYLLGGPRGGAGYRILSMGPDGKAGTADDVNGGTDNAPPAPSVVPTMSHQAEPE